MILEILAQKFFFMVTAISDFNAENKNCYNKDKVGRYHNWKQSFMARNTYYVS